jgi:hypothetical protein
MPTIMRCEKSERNIWETKPYSFAPMFHLYREYAGAVPYNLVYFASQVITVMTPFLSIFGGGGYAY